MALKTSELVHFPRFSCTGLWTQGLLCADSAPGSCSLRGLRDPGWFLFWALIPKRAWAAHSPQILSAQSLANHLHCFSPSFTHLAWKQSHPQLWFFGISPHLGLFRGFDIIWDSDLYLSLFLYDALPQNSCLMIFIHIQHEHSLDASPWIQILCIWFWLWPRDVFTCAWYHTKFLFCASVFLQQVTFSCCCFCPHRPKADELPWELVLVSWGVWNMGQTLQD